jgi:hypothetical protein
MAKPVNGAGFAIPVLSYLRKLLVEDLYRRLGRSLAGIRLEYRH